MTTERAAEIDPLRRGRGNAVLSGVPLLPLPHHVGLTGLGVALGRDVHGVPPNRVVKVTDRIELLTLPTEGVALSRQFEPSPQNHIPSPTEASIPKLEVDQTVAPRPEEEIADALRSEPDIEDHSK